VKQRNAGHTGDSTGIEVHDLLTVDEAARLFGRDDPKLRQLVIWAGRVDPFMILQRVYYDKHGLFAGQFDEVPA
jgi:type IV secretion system protein VirD4